MTVTEARPTFSAAPGSIVEVRDEQWMVTSVDQDGDGYLVHVQGLTELVRDTTATFATVLDDIKTVDPAEATVVPDDSPGHRRARLWLEAMLRKSPVPLTDPTLTVATQGLADALGYQQTAVRQALDPDNLRPRILLADAVGLGKTLEIGMILSELVRRGRGERILVVTPRHVLEQMQFELWTRFALPFVRLDSVGIQRIRQQLPASRNPFTFYKRVIISIDTLKSDRYHAHLQKQGGTPSSSTRATTSRTPPPATTGSLGCWRAAPTPSYWPRRPRTTARLSRSPSSSACSTRAPYGLTAPWWRRNSSA